MTEFHCDKLCISIINIIHSERNIRTKTKQNFADVLTGLAKTIITVTADTDRATDCYDC